MAFLTRIAGAVALGAALLVGVGLSIPTARAGYVVTLTEQTGNVVANGSGPIDLAGLTFEAEGAVSNLIVPNGPGIVIGQSSLIDFYTGPFTGPNNFGSGVGTLGTATGGDRVGVLLFKFGTVGPTLLVPAGYIPNSPLTSTATFIGQTFATLGAAPGTYEWIWGNGPNQNFTLRIPSTAAVPEPSSLLVLGGALAGLLLVRVRRRSLDAG